MSFGLFSEDYWVDPYPLLAELRAKDPVHLDARGFWVVTRYADVATLLHDRRVDRDMSRLCVGAPELVLEGLDGLLEASRTMLFNLNLEEHARIRRAIAGIFKLRNIEGLSSRIEAVVDEVFRGLPESGEVDLVACCAKPLPLLILAELFSIPRADLPRLSCWIMDLLRTFEMDRSWPELKRANSAYLQLRDYLSKLIARRTDGSASDFLGGLLKDASELDSRQLVVNLMAILQAGQEVMTGLVANGMALLLRNPDSLQRLRDDSALLDGAIDELLRLEGPIPAVVRCTSEEIELGGKCIQPGVPILCMLNAANRDAEVFERPDELEVVRDPNPHLAFGGGPYFCLGAHLARLEGRLVFERLLRRYARLELASPKLHWTHSSNFRVLATLPVTVAR